MQMFARIKLINLYQKVNDYFAEGKILPANDRTTQ